MKGQQKNKFWNFVPANPQANQPAELILYGEIASESWWGDEVTPRQFSDDLKALGDVQEIVVRINSPGGDVFAANAIYTRLRDHPATIIVKIDGWAASSATIIAAAGDKVLVARNGVLMYHNPAMVLRGSYTEKDLAKQQETLSVIKNSIVNSYAMKTGKTTEEIAAIMDAETWYTGAEAVENGFADELMFEDAQTEVQDGSRVVVNSVAFDISAFRSVPTALFNSRSARDGGGFTDTFQQAATGQKKESASNMEFKTVEDLEKACPELVNQIRNAARESGAAAERARIKAIEDMTPDGFTAIVAAAKFEKPASAENVAMQILAAQKAQGAKFLADRETDVESGNLGGIGSEAHETPGDGEENPFDAAIDRVFPTTK